MNPWHYFRIAAQVANKQADRRTHRIGAVGMRADGVLVAAHNGTAENKLPAVHAEARLCRKMDKNGVVFVARKTSTGFMMSRPCNSCQSIMRARKVKRVYYTIKDREYGVIDL